MAHGAWTLELSAQVKGHNIGNESSAHHATFSTVIAIYIHLVPLRVHHASMQCIINAPVLLYYVEESKEFDLASSYVVNSLYTSCQSP